MLINRVRAPKHRSGLDQCAQLYSKQQPVSSRMNDCCGACMRKETVGQKRRELYSTVFYSTVLSCSALYGYGSSSFFSLGEVLLAACIFRIGALGVKGHGGYAYLVPFSSLSWAVRRKRLFACSSHSSHSSHWESAVAQRLGRGAQATRPHIVA